jgi:hypothetical protein
MRICPQCGVELDEHMSVCPLCNCSDFQHQANPTDNVITRDDQPDEKFLSGFFSLTREQKRKLFWELSGIILLSGVLITLIIDMVTSKSITWSRYTVTVFLVMFVNTTLLSFWRNRILLFLGGSFLSTSLLLVLLDMYNNRIGWGTQLGVPILFAFYLIVFIMTRVISVTKQRGFNILGYGFIAAGAMSVCIDGILSQYSTNEISLRWSLIVFACIIPVAAILFFLHYRLNKGVDLRRFFHI